MPFALIFYFFIAFAVFSIFMRSNPIAVQISSLNLIISATNIPLLAVIARLEADIMKPPSLPPSCNGMKNSRLANSDVKASIMTHAEQLTSGITTSSTNIISKLERKRQAISRSTAETNVLG